MEGWMRLIRWVASSGKSRGQVAGQAAYIYPWSGPTVVAADIMPRSQAESRLDPPRSSHWMNTSSVTSDVLLLVPDSSQQTEPDGSPSSQGDPFGLTACDAMASKRRSLVDVIHGHAMDDAAFNREPAARNPEPIAKAGASVRAIPTRLPVRNGRSARPRYEPAARPPSPRL